jgi:hypothetical protein
MEVNSALLFPYQAHTIAEGSNLSTVSAPHLIRIAAAGRYHAFLFPLANLWGRSRQNRITNPETRISGYMAFVICVKLNKATASADLATCIALL